MTQDQRQFRFFQEVAELARAAGNAQRLMLLQHIAQAERPVERLAELSGLTIANASQHLQQLKRSNLVLSRREGKNILYRLGNGPVVELIGALTRLAEFNRAEIRALVDDSYNRKDSLEGISRQELLSRIHDNTVTILDVRPQEEFAAGHLPGAINIPIGELEARLSELPGRHEIVAYCRGARCVFSSDAAMLLRSKGRPARHFSDGFPSWKAAGLSVETSL